MKNLTIILAILASVVPVPAASARNLVVSDDITDPMTLDPHRQFSEKNHTICQQIFDGLIRFDPDGKIEPALAVSWERIGDSRIRFKLREGVFFHNGELFDSEAVKFSIERYLNPETGFPAGAFIDSITGVETPDKYTADIITRYPDGILLNRLAAFILIVPPLYIKEKGVEYFAANPVGTGAFVFKSWEKGRQITLEANRKYWLSGYPKIDGLVFKFIPQAKQLDALFSGEIDLITDLPGSQTLKVMKHPGTTVVKKASFYTVLASMNLSTGPLSNILVRKALNYAIDKAKLIRYDLLGNGRPIATFSMPGETGHNELLQPYEYNAKRAMELLIKAGYPEGFRLKMLVKANAERTAKGVSSEFEKIGIHVEKKLVTDADMLKEFSKKIYDVAIGDIPDPMCHVYFMQRMLLSSQSPYCLGSDPKIDVMLRDMVTILDSNASIKAAKNIDAYVYDNALSIFTYQRMALYGVGKDLQFVPYLSRMPYFYRSYFYDHETKKKK